jgi:histidyl-tRNA synthetase
MASWPQPVKVFYMGPYFRYERPQAGRYRQFSQIGAEVIGDPGPYSDAELLAMLLRFLSRWPFDDLEVGLNSVGDPECRQRYSRRLREYLEPRRGELGADSRRRLETNPLRILDTKVPAERRLLEGAPRLRDSLGREAREHFAAVCEQLDRLDIAYRIDDGLVRGLDYYTRTVFEISSAGLGAQNAILGGGRYDGLIRELGGPAVPGIGFAIGQDRLVELLSGGLTIVESPVCVIPVGAPCLDDALQLAEELRDAGMTAVAELGPPRALKTVLRKADRSGHDWIVLIGEDERAAGTAVLKSFQSGFQETIPREGFAAAVKARMEPHE